MSEGHLYRAVLQVACLIVLLGAARSARANDSVFGGHAAALVPLEETQVQMRAEDIVLTAHATKMNWDVRAVYEFVNHGSAPVTLQVGFPELRCPKDDENCTNVSFKNLRTLVDGRAVKHRKGKLGNGHEWKDYLGVVWLFDVTFPPTKPVTITHSYSLPGGAVSDGMRFASYVTRTGVTWAKTIKKARFTMRLPPFTHSVRAIEAKGLRCQPPRVADDGLIEVVAEGTNWVPVADLEFAFNASSMRTAFFDCTSYVRPDRAQECINLLYAVKGYPFKSKQLREQLYSGDSSFRPSSDLGSKWWKRTTPPQPRFTTDWFEPWEQRLLGNLEKAAKEYRSTQQTAAEAVGEQLPLPSPSTSASPELDAPAIPEPRASASPSSSTAMKAPPTPSPTTAPAAKKSPAPTIEPSTRAKRRTLCQISGVGLDGSWPPFAWLALAPLAARSRRRRRRRG